MTGGERKEEFITFLLDSLISVVECAYAITIHIYLLPGTSYLEITKINYFVCVPVIACTEVFGCKLSIELLLVRQNRLNPLKVMAILNI